MHWLAARQSVMGKVSRCVILYDIVVCMCLQPAEYLRWLLKGNTSQLTVGITLQLLIFTH